MAKETNIIFVYDTQLLQKEEDDPTTAILYFHPTWVSDQQKTALCGQIMGTINCIRNILSTPKIVSLQSGKFFIIENGRYLLAVGTDRNISDWLLEHRANILYSLIHFFHKDFEALSEIYQYEAMSAKLYHIFDTYLKMLVFSGNVFSYIPSLSLPKSASTVFTEAMCLLESCREFSNVLGGTILYHNKVVATQLTSDLTKHIVLADPYRIKCPAEIGEVSFELPLGVQLLQVYITNKDYCSLLETSLRNRCIFQYLNNKSIKKPHSKPSQQDTQIISTMKRDQSLLFTAVPEEDDQDPVLSLSTHQEQPAFVTLHKKPRPKFLNIKSLSIDQSDVIKENVVSPATTPFCGQTSVASTPMTELKRFVHQKPLSLVPADDQILCNESNKVIKEKPLGITNNIDEILKYVNGGRTYASIQSILYDPRKYSSLTDLNSISKNSEQYYKLKQKLDLEMSPKLQVQKSQDISKSITDPLFPIMKSNGISISHNYYENSLKLTTNLMERIIRNDRDTEDVTTHTTSTVISHKTAIPYDESHISKTLKFESNDKDTTNRRKSLTLPLKSLSEDETNARNTRRYSSGVLLTPLMSKLSMLPFENDQIVTPALTPSTSLSFMSQFAKANAKEIRNAKMENEMMLQKCVLFVCGQQDAVLAMLMKEECCKDKETIGKLWDICTEHLNKLEKQLDFCMESQSGASSTTQDSEPYSFLCLDDEWDTVKRGGPWAANDSTALTTLHGDFIDNEDLTEILIRGNDNIVYGHHCGPSEIFYHESHGPTTGLPPPSDPMGLVQLKAKRRLERDHGVILL